MGRIVTAAGIVGCTHGGVATATQMSSRVAISGRPIVTVTSGPSYAVVCAAQPTPCATGFWLVGANRVTSDRMPVALDDGTSLCQPTMARLEVRSDQSSVEAS